jgi:hypothetical protein
VASNQLECSMLKICWIKKMWRLQIFTLDSPFKPRIMHHREESSLAKRLLRSQLRHTQMASHQFKMVTSVLMMSMDALSLHQLKLCLEMVLHIEDTKIRLKMERHARDGTDNGQTLTLLETKTVL